MIVYLFIDFQKSEFKIITLCRVCVVPPSSYYPLAQATDAGPHVSP